MEEDGTKTIVAWVKLITATATAVATIAAAGTALYAALDGVKKAEAAGNKTDGAYAALASKIDALAIEVAYLKGRVEGREVIIERSPTKPTSKATPRSEIKMKLKKAAAARTSAPPSFKKGAKFNVRPFQDLPDKLDDLVQMQSEYQSDH